MLGLATAAPAQADITNELAYSCAVSDLGITFDDPWTVDLTVGVDAQYDQGAAIAAPAITAAVTPGEDANTQMRALGITSLEGTASTKYSFGDTERTAELTIPKVDVPAEGSVTTTATGTGSAETAPAEDTTVDITAGNFTAQLTTDTGFVLNLACTAPADNAVGAVTIGEAAPPVEEPTTPPVEEPTTPPVEEPTTPPVEDTAGGDVAQPEVPEVVQTDGARGDSSKAPLALGGLLFAGAGAGAVVVARRKATQH